VDEVDGLVIGAGVIGLAVARALALAGREVLVVEQGDRIGAETSSRNSEVIHAGIYYRPGSLKAQLCVAGRERLYDYCRTRGVGHRRCSKLIVAASPAQVPELEAIAATAARNGVDDLVLIAADEARRLEPELKCAAALLSPSTGILDSHGYMLALQGEAEAHGAVLAFGARVTAIRPGPQGLAVCFDGETAPQLRARLVVNAAGLQAPALAAAVEGLAPAFKPKAWFAKGTYFTLTGRAPFSRLIYPVPEPGGLGVHLTLDLAGQARFGPDVEWVEAPDYTVDPARADRFYGSVRSYWPGLADGQLAPGYAGVRPKLSGPGEPAADFRIDGPAEHGIDGLINLFGIESPGLTASLALADEVARLG
jgi:L-2-hydroxyglutarate oxidase LhgO